MDLTCHMVELQMKGRDDYQVYLLQVFGDCRQRGRRIMIKAEEWSGAVKTRACSLSPYLVVERELIYL